MLGFLCIRITYAIMFVVLTILFIFFTFMGVEMDYSYPWGCHCISIYLWSSCLLLSGQKNVGHFLECWCSCRNLYYRTLMENRGYGGVNPHILYCLSSLLLFYLKIFSQGRLGDLREIYSLHFSQFF